jgi:LysM repeat protein
MLTSAIAPSSPEKIEYIVKPGDVLAKISRKLKTTPELIMRMNNMSGTMLRIGEKLLISHPEFSMVIQRKANLVTLLNRGAFSQYHVREAKLPPKQPSKIAARWPRRWLGRMENAWAWVKGLSCEHQVDPDCRRRGLHSLFDARWSPSESRPAATADRACLAATDLEELSSLVNKKTSVTIID